MGLVMQAIEEMELAYQAFREITEQLLNDEKSTHSPAERVEVQSLFDTIFHAYQKLHRHHSHQKKEIISKTESINQTINAIFFVQLTLVLIAGMLVVVYFDRVVLKVFDMTENMALHDRLTGLYNRHVLDRIKSELGRSRENREKGYGLILLDIDHFKMFNDTYGHPAGDQLLKKMSELLLGAVRRQDKIIRFGGEEILIILFWVDISGVKKVAEKIRGSVEGTLFDLNDGKAPKNVTVSAGYASSTSDEGSFDDLLQLADTRLYDAKKSGRNRVAGPDM
ncbi:hypothetical protein DSLASN_35280 [Desulfoluna limicola]|uniref:diguanylate cyclase n=2 Tax=Desulfoluna limicola TaxID=2810562 RepID=A0ABM7PLD1_9BACT|nr:hypothetical protein DSLASN_35280 [Desulfoluna limicola]